MCPGRRQNGSRFSQVFRLLADVFRFRFYTTKRDHSNEHKKGGNAASEGLPLRCLIMTLPRPRLGTPKHKLIAICKSNIARPLPCGETGDTTEHLGVHRGTRRPRSTGNGTGSGAMLRDVTARQLFIACEASVSCARAPGGTIGSAVRQPVRRESTAKGWPEIDRKISRPHPRAASMEAPGTL